MVPSDRPAAPLVFSPVSTALVRSNKGETAIPLSISLTILHGVPSSSNRRVCEFMGIRGLSRTVMAGAAICVPNRYHSHVFVYVCVHVYYFAEYQYSYPKNSLSSLNSSPTRSACISEYTSL